MSRRAIIIDTDPGQDDAVAILLAFAHEAVLDLKLIATVAGNVPIEKTTANALRIRDLGGRHQAPVIAGMAAPMVVPLETAEYICGPDGLAGANLPPAVSSAQAGHAVDAIIEIIRSAPDKTITLCTLGPLTNIAMALRLAPDIASRLAEIVIMGGAMGLGNVTPAAEFNFHVDPHAAAVVLGAGVKTTLFGLHLTHQAVSSPAHIERLAGLSNKAGRAVHGMLTRPRPGGLGTTAHPMHDPCVIAWLLWPELFKGRECHVEIETEGRLRGRSTIDWNGRMKRTPNAFVPNEVDAKTFFDRLTDAVETLP